MKSENYKCICKCPWIDNIKFKQIIVINENHIYDDKIFNAVEYF